MKRTVLMVDDDQDDFFLVRDTLNDIKADIDLLYLQNATNILEYLNSCERAPSLILLDLNMPGIDGKTVLKQLKEHHVFKAIPIVMFTTSRSPEEQEICMKLKANSFVSKPLSYVQWGAVLHSICALYVKEALN